MCNMSWGSIKKILGMLESKGYIEDLSDGEKRKHYCVTSQGREVLGYYSGLHELVRV